MYKMYVVSIEDLLWLQVVLSSFVLNLVCTVMACYVL